MRRRRLFWKIYPYYFVIIVVALTLTAFYGSREMRTMYTAQISSTLEARAMMTARNMRSFLLAGDVLELDQECKEVANLSGSRITIVNAEGIVLGDSYEDPGRMENHGTRPEIVQAYGKEVGISTRYSSTLQASMMYVAVPVMEDNEVIAVVRASVPVSAVKDTLASFYRNIVIGGLLIVVLAGLVSVALFRKLTVPLRELRDGAIKFANGDFSTKLMVPDVDEIADLSISMNSMASQLDSRIRTIGEQRNEREAILLSMSEGVLALDNNEKIVSLNRVAADILRLNPEQARGRAIYEMVRISSLLNFTEQASHSSEMTETEIALSGATEKYIQVRAAMLKDKLGQRVGTVLVFNDITRLRKLEGIRREFVANVSHELKTPITAITGSVETLLDSDAISPEDNRRFLEMIARHSERLNNLVDDLLSLAGLESESEKNEVVLTRTGLAEVLKASLMACQEKSKRHQVHLNSSCDPDLELNMNRGQIEQAVTNLVDNAIKYSDAGSTIDVEAITTGNEILISVKDRGVGIAKEHLPRLFERFYRVDQARSREAGGTGLGLAIVKHIAVAHGGHVTVESERGAGSIFRIHLPSLQ